MPFNGRMDEENVEYIHIKILLSGKKLCLREICMQLDGNRKHYPEWGITDPKRWTWYVLTQNWFLEINKEPSSDEGWRYRQRPTLEHRNELPIFQWGAEGGRIGAKKSVPQVLQPPTETVGLIHWEPTKASWTVTEKAWDKTVLHEFGRQWGLLRSQEQWPRVLILPHVLALWEPSKFGWSPS